MKRAGHIRLLITVSLFTIAGLSFLFPLEEGWCARLADGEEQAAPSGSAVQPVPMPGKGADRKEAPARRATSERPVGGTSQPAREGVRRPAAATPAEEAVVPQQPQSQPALPPQPPQPKQAGAASQTGQYVTIDFDNVDIRVLIKFVSELTGRNFLLDERVKGKVTVISPRKIAVDEVYKVFESVLEIYGFSDGSGGRGDQGDPRAWTPGGRTWSFG